MDSPFSLDELRAAQVEHPADPHLALRLADALVATPALSDDDVVFTVDLASAALEGFAVDAPEMPAVVRVLGRALARANAWQEVLDLVAASRPRYPRWTELSLLEGVAHGSLGGPDHTRKMISALETCLSLGDDDVLPGTPGGGTTWPFFHLASLAERSGDEVGARTLYARAMPLPEADLALARLAEAAAVRAAREGKVPARLADDGVLATKACRHGTFTYPVRDRFVGRALDLYGEWCEAELGVLARYVPEGATVVDVGANLGTHAVFFAKKVGRAGRVVAFEPQSFTHALLTRNVEANALQNVVARREAVGARAGEATFPVLDPRTAANFGAAAATASGDGERVPVVALDALGLERCDLLKVDVEGAEVDVLAGARETITRLRPVLFVENNTVERSADVIRAVTELGYRAYWHIARYWSPENHFRNAEDVFAVYQPEANLLCVPCERAAELAPDLPEVEGEDDDFTKAIARTQRTPKPVTPKRPFTLVVCIPGREFSGRFFDAWNAFAERCRDLGIRLVVSRAYDAVVYYARNKVAGGDVRRGPRQAPFGGEVDYDYMLWIDSDVVFRFEDFQRDRKSVV